MVEDAHPDRTSLDMEFGDVATASEAFGLLADETRLRILLTLAEENGVTSFQTRDGLSFGELRRSVGVEDTGRFNYHLGKLRDHFVRKTDDGYQLRYAGYRVTTDVTAGVYHADTPTHTGETTVPCVQSDCEETMRITYEEGMVSLSCPIEEHPGTFQTPLPPNAAVDRSPTALLTTATRDARHMMEHIQSGTCPLCWSTLERTLPSQVLPQDAPPAVDVECSGCWFETTTPVAVFAVHHPAVQQAYQAGGRPLDETPYLAYPFVRRPDSSTVRAQDPIRIAVDTDPDDAYGSPVLVYNGQLEVTAIE